jgi:hypothetical protein
VKGNKKGKEEGSKKVEGEGKIINHGMRKEGVVDGGGLYIGLKTIFLSPFQTDIFPPLVARNYYSSGTFYFCPF